MGTAAQLAVAVVALLHVYFLVLEMFLWTTPYGRRVFHLSAEYANASAPLAKNQGLYNGFLAAGLVWGLLAGSPDGFGIQIFFLSCVVVAGVFGGLVLTDAMADWPALARWGPEYFKATCGEALVEIMSGRSRDPRYEINAYDHKSEVRFADYVEMVAAGGESNDYYLVANNGFFDRPEMRPLYDDIRFPEHLDPAQTDGRVHFWFGPAGTVTPLHHDLMNVLMAQVYGRKRVTLISPDQTHRLYNEIGVFSEVDPEDPDYDRHPLYRDVEALRVDLAPGEALFLPVGWWHHVRALDVSVTVTFTNFVHRNEFEWRNPEGQ